MPNSYGIYMRDSHINDSNDVYTNISPHPYTCTRSPHTDVYAQQDSVIHQKWFKGVCVRDVYVWYSILVLVEPPYLWT